MSGALAPVAPPVRVLHKLARWLYTRKQVGRQVCISMPFIALLWVCLRQHLARLVRERWRPSPQLERPAPRASQRQQQDDPFERLPGGPEEFEKRYAMIGRITDSTYGSVFDCRPLQGMCGVPRCVKIVRKIDHPLLSAAAMQHPSGFGKAKMKAKAAKALARPGLQGREPDEFWRYMWKLRSLRHENVVRYLEFFADRSSFYFVMEKCMGRTLLDHMLVVPIWNESAARPLIRQLLEALRYIHDLRLIHRDVKLENLMILPLSSPREGHRSRLQILDFGLGCEMESAFGAMGTLGYMAPEVFSGKPYRQNVDLFAAGVVLHILLTGRPAFQPPMSARFVDDHLEALCRGPDRRRDPFPRVTKSGQDLLCWMLTPSPVVRCSSWEALEHRWLQGGASGGFLDAGEKEDPQLWSSDDSELQFLRVMGVWQGSSTACALSSVVASQSLLSIDEVEAEEEALLEELCLSLVRQMTLAVCVADPNKDGCPIKAVSHGFEELVGCREADSVGGDLAHFCGLRREAAPAAVLDRLDEACVADGSFFDIVPLEPVSGTKAAALHISPIDVHGVRVLLAVLVQVSDPDAVDLQGPELASSWRKVHTTIRHWITHGRHGTGPGLSEKLVN